MLGLGNLLILAGYTLVYAAVANGGAFAANPWDGLFSDAYTESEAGTSGSSSTGSGSDGTSLTGGLPSAVRSGNVGGILKGLTVGTPNEPLTPAWIYRLIGGRSKPGTTIPSSAKPGEATRGRPQGQTR